MRGGALAGPRARRRRAEAPGAGPALGCSEGIDLQYAAARWQGPAHAGGTRSRLGQARH